MEKDWYKSKTIWTGISAVALALGSYFAGEAEMTVVFQAIIGLGLIFLRLGVGVSISTVPKKRK